MPMYETFESILQVAEAIRLYQESEILPLALE